jgi:hypothetical protein
LNSPQKNRIFTEKKGFLSQKGAHPAVQKTAQEKMTEEVAAVAAVSDRSSHQYKDLM